MYDLLAGVCLTVDASSKPYAMFAIPLVFDIVIIVLTAFRSYHLATALQRGSGPAIARTFLSDGTTGISDLHTWQLYTMFRDGMLYVLLKQGIPGY